MSTSKCEKKRERRLNAFGCDVGGRQIEKRKKKLFITIPFPIKLKLHFSNSSILLHSLKVSLGENSRTRQLTWIAALSRPIHHMPKFITIFIVNSTNVNSLSSQISPLLPSWNWSLTYPRDPSERARVSGNTWKWSLPFWAPQDVHKAKKKK